jgi:hypothetical protein
MKNLLGAEALARSAQQLDDEGLQSAPSFERDLTIVDVKRVSKSVHNEPDSLHLLGELRQRYASHAPRRRQIDEDFAARGLVGSVGVVARGRE